MRRDPSICIAVRDNLETDFETGLGIVFISLGDDVLGRHNRQALLRGNRGA